MSAYHVARPSRRCAQGCQWIGIPMRADQRPPSHGTPWRLEPVAPSHHGHVLNGTPGQPEAAQLGSHRCTNSYCVLEYITTGRPPHSTLVPLARLSLHSHVPNTTPQTCLARNSNAGLTYFANNGSASSCSCRSNACPISSPTTNSVSTPTRFNSSCARTVSW